MVKFVIKRRLELDFLGAEWKKAYIVFSSFKPTEMKQVIEFEENTEPVKLMDKMTAMLTEHFIEGKGYDEESKKLQPIRKSDLSDMTLAIFDRVISLQRGNIAIPKS